MKRMTDVKRDKMVIFANAMIAKGKLRKDIVDAVRDKFGFSQSSGAALSLRCSGVDLPPGQYAYSIKKPSDPVQKDQQNIDTVRHPYIKVVRIIDAKHGYSAQFKEGVIYVNGKPCPTHKAFALAGEKYPSW
jgi:hypothetical protein